MRKPTQEEIDELAEFIETHLGMPLDRWQRLLIETAWDEHE